MKGLSLHNSTKKNNHVLCILPVLLLFYYIIVKRLIIKGKVQSQHMTHRWVNKYAYILTECYSILEEFLKFDSCLKAMDMDEEGRPPQL